ncbi:hypothetical protein [Flavobacterium aciduliphilum]|uniref:Uncharacterized protein n=1 Tax=Flavobacterium aciduliphilum TaxID=1101402 RepID=A0A328Y9X3_9FLAO|nr:hypothetical protein [Flavobacterium aciduliphilum]RAR70808.1 hypothetical protein CLV55_10959 [Flavobacterium aciduliphilum]
MKLSQNNIDTGKLIEIYITKNRISKTELGRKINRKGISILRFIESPSMQTGILIDICHAVKHNFLHDLAIQLPSDFTKNEVEDTERISKENEMKALINMLQEENNTLRIQNELLMKLKG